MTITYGHAVPYINEYVDGYQACLAGKTQRNNPYKNKLNSDEYKNWKMGFLSAKNVKIEGTDKNLDLEKIIKQYKSRHPNK